MRRSGGNRGFSLMELMVTVALVGILASVAYPSYEGYVRKQNRATAKAALLDAANRQEQFFADNKQYSAVLTSLGFTANPFSVDRNGRVVAVGSAGAVYEISLAAPAAAPRLTYTLSATPRNAQAKDTHCGTLTLTNTGARSAAATDCW